MLLCLAGTRGVGKTTLLEKLTTSFPDLYSRPRSFTTRSARNVASDHYFDFVTEQEFDRMAHDGEFVQVDQAYGNRYAIHQQSLSDIAKSGRIAVHEISHTNQRRLEEAGVPVFRVAITRRGHPASDKELPPGSVTPDSYHALIDVSSGPDKASLRLNNLIQAHVAWIARFPDERLIDTTNVHAYDALAPWFTDDARPTTRDFHRMSEPWWLSHLTQATPDTHILELGAGNGWLTALLRRVGLNPVSVEAAKSMGTKESRLQAPRKSCQSIRFLPFEDGQFDLIVGSLVEGAHYSLAFCEMQRVLKTSGTLLLTSPSRRWANQVRRDWTDFHSTTFAVDERPIYVHSFVHDHDTLRQLLAIAGIRQVGISEISAEVDGIAPESPIAEAAAASSGTTLRTFPMVDAIEARRD